jgi:anti-sigma factor ChrR (cupin superfamily)
MITFTQQKLTDEALQPSLNLPNQVSWALLAEAGDYKVEYVKWQPGTVYAPHEHLDTEYIFLFSGDLSDGNTAFERCSIVTYPPGSRHENLRTETGAEFILIWTGRERVKKF